jgi:CHAT domain-containing protein
MKAQCPDKYFLEKRMTYLRDSSKLSPQQQLVELNAYLDKMQICSYRNDSTHARLAKRIGGLYYQESDYLNAIKYYQQSIDIITANAGQPSVNLTELPGTYYWLSMMYEALNRVNERMTALERCYKVAVRIHYIDAACLRALYEWGIYLFDLGDYHRCIDFMRQCESFSKSYPNLTAPNLREEFISSSLLWQVKALLEIKHFDEAQDLLTNRAEECKNAGLINNLSTVFSQLAELQVRKGNYNEALAFYKRALRNDQRLGYDFYCKQHLKDIGYNIYFLHSSKIDKALAYYRSALEMTNKDPSLNGADISESLDLYRLIANAYGRKGRFDLTYYYFQRAFDQIEPGINEAGVLNSSSEELKKIKKINYLTGLIIDKGDAYQSQFYVTKNRGALVEAIRIYKAADQFLNRVKAEQTDVQSKLFWRNDSRRLYENAIQACYLQNNLVDAFYFFEKSRAVLLQDQLNEQHWSGQNNILKQTQLQKKVLQLEKQANGLDKASANYSELENEIFNSRQELVHLQELIKANDPLYYQSFVDKTSISIQDVRQKILNDHQGLVELFAGDSAVYVLAITGHRSYLQKVGKAEFESLSDEYRTFISNADLLNNNFMAFKNISFRLYQLVFRNIDLPAGRIVISPDGKYFPFEALVVNMQPVTYFLEDHAVTYTYSARYLLNDFSNTRAFNSYTFMGIAPVEYRNGLASLPGSDQSIKRVQNYFSNATSLIRGNASKNNFLKEYYKYKIIQLYTHAKGGYNSEPTIYFADSALSLSDLFYENKPSTSLIVLSACETAEGKLYSGEGVFSFNRQFAALGIPSAISNLWQVDDRSSYEITELFYKYLVKGLPVDVALQKAKKEFKSISSKEQNLPYYWAGSILVGQGSPIQLQRPFPWGWAAAIVIALLLLALGIMKVAQSEKFESIRNRLLYQNTC